jgi:hypothetical protein
VWKCAWVYSRNDKVSVEQAECNVKQEPVLGVPRKKFEFYSHCNGESEEGMEGVYNMICFDFVSFPKILCCCGMS